MIADQPFAALNAALFADGFVLEVAPGVVVEQPIEIVHLASGDVPASLHTRSLVTLGAHSRVRLIESFAGAGRYWRNDVVSLAARRRRRARPRGAGRRGGGCPPSRRDRGYARRGLAARQLRLAARRPHRAPRGHRAQRGRGGALRASRRLSAGGSPRGQHRHHGRAIWPWAARPAKSSRGWRPGGRTAPFRAASRSLPARRKPMRTC